jgi:hypothetical protein
MYYNDHLPPHFHAKYGNAEVYIQNGVVFKGFFPAKQLKLVLAWCEIHSDKLMENWHLAEQHESIKRIEPLK